MNDRARTQNRRTPPLEDDQVLKENKRRVIKLLIEKPGLASYRDIERAFNEKPSHEDHMAYDTVRENVDRLESENYLKKGWTVNFKKIGYEIAYRIDVMIDPFQIEIARDPKSKIPVQNPQQVLARKIMRLVEQEPFKNWVLIENVEILLGDPADLCVTARVGQHTDIFDFVTRGLRSLPGIRQTSTCQISWSVRDQEVRGPLDEPTIERHK